MTKRFLNNVFAGLIVSIFVLSAFMGVAKAETLSIWSCLTQESRVKVLQKIANDFEAKHPGVDVQITTMPWGGAMDKMVAAILAGNPPDLATVGQGWPQSLAGTGGIIPLDDVVANLGGPKVFLGTSLSQGQLNDKSYAIPLYVTPHLFFYRKSWLAEAKLEVPDSWDSLYKAATAVTNPKKGRYGFAIPFDIHGGKPIWGFLLSNGVTIFDKAKDGSWVLNVNQPAAVQTYEYLAKLLRNAAPSGVVSYTTNNIRELVAKGVLWGRYDTPELLYTVRELSPDLLNDFGYFPLPPGTRYGSSQGWVGLVAFKTSRQALAKKFIEFLMQEDNLIDFSLSYPYAMFPALADAYKNPRYASGLPTELKSMVETAPKVLRYASAISMWNGPNPWAGEIENKLILPNALSRMLVNGISAKQAVQEVEREIKELMTAQ